MPAISQYRHRKRPHFTTASQNGNAVQKTVDIVKYYGRILQRSKQREATLNMKRSKTMANANIHHRPFERIAIVDRGEAAMRLIRAVRELNHEQSMSLSTVALFTEPDRRAMFVREAGDAVCIGPATFIDQRDQGQKSSYHDSGRIEQALVKARADAAWVGWGLLAEEPWFADLCSRLGMVFIGPDARMLRLLGHKISAKHLAQQAGVPTIPWSGGTAACRAARIPAHGQASA
jgi:biotin carboxylase